MSNHAQIEFVIPDNVSFVRTVIRLNPIALFLSVIGLAMLVIGISALATGLVWSKVWPWILIPSLTIVTSGLYLSYNLWQQIKYVDVYFERNRASNHVLRNILLNERSRGTQARELLFDELLLGMLRVDYETFKPLFYDIHTEDVRAFREYCDRKQRDLQPELRKKLASNPDPDHPRGTISTKENDDLSGILRMLDDILAN